MIASRTRQLAFTLLTLLYAWASAQFEDPSDRFELRQIDPPFASGSRWVHPADLDGDGDWDLLRTEIWFENLGGHPPDFALHEFPDPIGSKKKPADLDGDGDTDLLDDGFHTLVGERWRLAPPSFTVKAYTLRQQCTTHDFTPSGFFSVIISRGIHQCLLASSAPTSMPASSGRTSPSRS
jgi:hypothetical protein